MNNSTNKTPGNASSFKELVDSDKRSILEKVLSSSLPRPSIPKTVVSASSNGKSQSTASTDYDAVFGEDIDDIDELFDDIMKRARAEYEKQKELKEKNPEYQILEDLLFKKPRGKAKAKAVRKKKTQTRAITKTLEIMNDFRQKLVESEEEPVSFPRTFTSNADYDKFKSSIRTLVEGSKANKRPYPKWKTTETYSPVFSTITNPNWANLPKSTAENSLAKKMYTPVRNKLYTPGHINSWMDAATNSNPAELPSCKSIRSDVAVHDSDSDEDGTKSIDNTSLFFSPQFEKTVTNKSSSTDYKTPAKNTLNSSTPMKSTTVRFKPSPPEYFVYGNSQNSSVVSNAISEKENGYNGQIDSSTQNYNEFSQDNISANSVKLHNSPPLWQNGHSPPAENIEYEEHHHFFRSSERLDQVQKKGSTDSKKKSMFVEDFARKLSYNVSNRYNMEVKCSMKVKYYK